jgi:hypothetical protein
MPFNVSVNVVLVQTDHRGDLVKNIALGSGMIPVQSGVSIDWVRDIIDTFLMALQRLIEKGPTV